MRYPDYHDGKVAFAYLGDIWTADEDGKNIQRLTVHTARDIHPRFSPDGRSIAFSSDREGNMDVYRDPHRRRRRQAPDDPLGRRHGARLDARRQGNPVRQPARRRFHGQALRRLDRRRPAPRRRARHGSRRLVTLPMAPSWPSTARPRPYWRKYYRGAYQSDVTVMDLASKTFKDLTSFDGMDSWPLWSRDGTSTS